MSGSPRVVCVGVVTLDALALVPRYPGEDERVVGEEVSISGGGPAANAAVVLARQGQSVAFVGRVGADRAGETAKAMLSAEGVDVTGVLTDANHPTQASCIVVSQQRQTRAISTLSVPPLPPLATFGARALELIDSAEWLHTDHLGLGPVTAYLKSLPASERPRLAVDAGNPIPGLDLSAVDLYAPTTEALVATWSLPHDEAGIAEAARRALDEGAKAVVATRGSAGSWAWWSERYDGRPAGTVHVPAVKGIDIRSTLGAGDVFHGGLLSALVRGGDWPQALREANATAALSCRALDGREAVPTLAELNTFLGS
ncbi:carbohydrate kinase family protein [Pleomorphomonas sp. JP5]|uniref:carbohydrate kinase family protein n=1 Tax=Pleomorphomonas sp. JP5 TaxID=2942998 RepID=UPI00204344CB|nr:carbohydrate kinase family protein [Pleomorphomonas sp. JP5]MCM5557310.1 carbohydrate kinase family protein [Pleomorphomonas sp. JP5]